MLPLLPAIFPARSTYAHFLRGARCVPTASARASQLNSQPKPAAPMESIVERGGGVRGLMILECAFVHGNSYVEGNEWEGKTRLAPCAKPCRCQWRRDMLHIDLLSAHDSAQFQAPSQANMKLNKAPEAERDATRRRRRTKTPARHRRAPSPSTSTQQNSTVHSTPVQREAGRPARMAADAEAERDCESESACAKPKRHVRCSPPPRPPVLRPVPFESECVRAACAAAAACMLLPQCRHASWLLLAGRPAKRFPQQRTELKWVRRQSHRRHRHHVRDSRARRAATANRRLDQWDSRPRSRDSLCYALPLAPLSL